ncbi:hypothetical protein B0H21DRAFT_329760 [Amylocystis lapponica]|nr:hypothetical protein B0H21DRAFT_329760 [Amylocystis lapponica]
MQSSSVTRVDPSILPPEVTDQIIDNLCGDSEALRQCALTCRAWRPRSQLCLIQDVTIGSRTGLKAFAAHLRGARCMSYPHSLCLAQCNDSTMKAEHQFVHLVPLVLPQVLESVKVIVIERINWDYFPPHPTFRFIATQFPHVVSLTLRDCSFCSLKELYTILSAFPSLLDLYLMNISGTNISTPPAPTIHPRMRARLKELHLHVFVPEVSRSMLEFLTHCQCLESLRDLHLFAPIADEATMRKFNQAIGPCLESLHFSGMDGAKLLTTCTRLHTLWVSLATPDTLVDQLSSMVSHDLRKLEIYASTGGNNLDEMLLQWHRMAMGAAERRCRARRVGGEVPGTASEVAFPENSTGRVGYTTNANTL